MSTTHTDDMRQHFEPDGSPARQQLGDAGAHCALPSGSAPSLEAVAQVLDQVEMAAEQAGKPYQWSPAQTVRDAEVMAFQFAKKLNAVLGLNEREIAWLKANGGTFDESEPNGKADR